MALVEDMLKGNVVAALAVGSAALVLPKVLPDLSPRWRGIVKAGLSLFLESESDAEGGIIDRLADTALQNVLKGLSGPGSAEDRQQAAQGTVEAFKRMAQGRAQRYGRDEGDRSRRYGRHVAALRRAVDQERSRHPGGEHAAALEKLSATLASDAQPYHAAG